MEEIHERLKAELDRLGMKPVDAARAAGLDSSQGLRDVIAGRKRLTVDLLGLLAQAGIDVLYVTTGQRMQQEPLPIKPEHRALISNYEACDPEDQKAIRRLASTAAQSAEVVPDELLKKRA